MERTAGQDEGGLDGLATVDVGQAVAIVQQRLPYPSLGPPRDGPILEKAADPKGAVDTSGGRARLQTSSRWSLVY